MRVVLTKLKDDLASAARRIGRRPAPFILLALTFAVAIGTVTATFGVAYGLLNPVLPYAQPSRLVIARDKLSTFLVSPYNWTQNPSAGSVFAGLAEYHLETAIMQTPAQPRDVQIAYVTPGFFSVLGVPMALGGGFSAAAPPPQPGTALLPMVLSHRLWQEGFHSDPGVIGRVVHLALFNLNPSRFRVVGVAPEGVRLPRAAAAWVPEHLYNSRFFLSPGAPDWMHTTVARLRPGVGVAQAEAAIRAWPRTDPTWVWNQSADLVPLRQFLGGDLYRVAPWLWLITTVFLVLTVAAAVGICRGDFEERRNEFRIRGWLGCSGRRMLRVRGLEVGGALGLGLGGGVLVRWIVVRATVRLLGVSPATTARAVGLELLMALAAAGFAALLILLPEARQLGRLHLPGAIDQPRAGRFPGASFPRMGFGFPLQIFTATVILATAVLAFRGAYELAHIDPGVRPRGVYVADVTLPLPEDSYVYGVPNFGQLTMRQRGHVRDVRAANFHRMMGLYFSDIAARLRGRAGVSAVGVISMAPYSGYAQIGNGVWLSPAPEHAAANPLVYADVASMSRSAVAALGMKLLYGRNFDGSDRDTVIVSRALARRIAPGAGSLGWYVIPPGRAPARIVGIVADVHGKDLLTPPLPAVYYPFSHWGGSDADLVMRTTAPLSLKEAEALFQRAASAVVPGSTVTRVQTLRAMVASAGRLTRYCEQLVLWLALLGIFIVGVCAWSGASGQVRRRNHEIGVRLALGASTRHLSLVILGGQLGQSLGAACLGGLAAWWLSRAALHLIPGVVPAAGSFLLPVVGIESVVLAVSAWAFRKAMRRAPGELLSTLRN